MADSTKVGALTPRPVTAKTLLPIPPQLKLTKKQILFVEHYLRGETSYRAAINAGYSESIATVASVTVLRNPSVVLEIRRRADEAFKNERVDTDWVLQEAAKLAKSNMFDYIDIQEDGTFKVNLNRCNRDHGSAIQELSYDAEGRPKIRLVDKKASVELLARIKKMFNDTDKASGGDGALSIQAWDQIVQNITVNQQINVVKSQEGQKVLEGEV